MALPRAAAVAEVGWSPQTRDWSDFLKRLNAMTARYRAFDLNYADSTYGIQPQFTRTGNHIAVTLSNLPELRDAALDVSIRYTLDGREPDAASTRYAGPFSDALGTQLRAATFVGPERVSRVSTWDLNAHTGIRRTSHQLDLCSNDVGLLLEPRGAGNSGNTPLTVDIMNPCWIYRGVDLSHGPQIAAAVSALPFNYELPGDIGKIHVGDNRTANGELEARVDGCEGAVLETLPLPAAASAQAPAELAKRKLPSIAGRHDICLRFARPAVDPLWAIDWVEIQD
jgi:hexosaminidase